MSLGVEYDLRNRMYGHLQSLELAFFDGQQTGQLMSRATVDLQSVRFFLGYGLIFLLQSAITILIAAVVMFAVDPGLALVALASPLGHLDRLPLRPAQPAGHPGGAAADRRAHGRGRGEHRRRPRREGVRAGAAPAARFSRAVARVFDQSMVSTRLRAFSPFIGFLPQLGLAALLLVGGRQGDQRDHHGRRVHRLLRLRPDAHWPMRWLGMALGMAQRAVASGARVFELSGPALPSPRRRPAPGRCRPAGGRVELRGVTFGYDGEDPVVRDIDLDVEPGRTVALVGPTGSGKTTLVMLILRLYDVDEGAVLVDGVDVRDLDPASLRRGWPWSRTTRSCSRRRSPTTSPTRGPKSEDEIRLAAERRPRRAPRGASRGPRHAGWRARHTLSGGQRQRVAIARALLAEPRILILDDATSSVDATESRIKSALSEVMDGRTTFVIAHRLSTIALADEVVVLEDGEIAARGTHDELLELAALPRDRREGLARPGLPHPLRPRPRGGGAMNRPAGSDIS